jgi:hypothetical protein
MRRVDPTSILEYDDTHVKPYHPDEDEREFVGDVMHRFQQSEMRRKTYDWEIEFNRLMLRGDQLVARDTSTGDLVRLTLSDEARQRRYSIDNVLRPTIRAQVGKFTRVIPGVVVSPATDDEADVRSSQISTTWCEFFLRKERLRKKYVKAYRYCSWAGTAIWQLYWDKDAGRRIAWCPECSSIGDEVEIGAPCVVCEQEAEVAAQQAAQEQQQQVSQQYDMVLQQAAATGAPLPPAPDMPPPPEPDYESVPDMMGVNEGDVCVRLLDPRDFFPEPNAEEVEDMRWAIVRTARPVSEIRKMFPKYAENITHETGIHWERSVTLDQTIGSAADSGDFAYLYEVHEKPSELWPDGRLAFICDGIVLNKTENEAGEVVMGEPSPYRNLPTLPFYAFRLDRNEGVFWGESSITQSWGVQKERNRLLRQMREQRDMSNAPPLLVPMGSHISEDDFYEVHPRKVIKYNPMTGGKPQYLEIPPFASYTYNELERMRLAVQAQATVTDHEMGLTASDQSGRYAAFLEAQSAESVRSIVVENNDAWCEMFRGALILAQENYSADRMWAIRGKEKVKSYDWSQVNLVPGWDVVLSESDSLSQNPSLRLQQSERLLSLGYFNDPATGQPDMGRFGRIAGVEDGAASPDWDSSERAYAASLPDRILEGSMTLEQIRPWDDAKVCTEELAAWLRGPGRHHSEQEQWQVGQFWMTYASMMRPQSPGDMEVMPSQGPGGGGGGATPQQPPGMGSGALPGNPGTEMEQGIAQADQQAEQAARPGPNHEG